MMKINWNINGIVIGLSLLMRDALNLFAELYDEKGTPALQARLPVVHSRQVVEVLRKFAAQPKRLGDLEGEYFSTVMWDETNAQKDGTIKTVNPVRRSAPENWILSGPHFYVGNPFHQDAKSHL